VGRKKIAKAETSGAGCLLQDHQNISAVLRLRRHVSTRWKKKRIPSGLGEKKTDNIRIERRESPVRQKN